MGIEWRQSKERAPHSGVNARVVEAQGKAARILVSIDGMIDAASYREAPMGAMTRTFAGSAWSGGRTGRCVDDEAVWLFHDVFQYRKGPLTPSKVSMMIICP
ncbi:hypothetical protein [Rhizobium sp. PL01]|uniref:hypothetical protein n=1 Tax=Rhizobium sp. PL01 TaxID=3085631 RepID=UPI002981722E|nr:hypothetical protein [Rhizobium sp. PL01]MDW5318385.1 hypothetical protein [Rhizobium sp. PL01]